MRVASRAARGHDGPMSRNAGFVCVLLVAGCGSGDGFTAQSVDMAMPPDLAPPQPGPYPGGPYGVNKGDVLSDFTAKGYRLTTAQTDSSQLTYTDIKLSEVHANPYCQCLVLNESAEWCQPCQMEQSYLVDAVKADPRFCVFSVLVENTAMMRVQQTDLDDWTQTFAQDFSVVGGNIQTTVHLPDPMYLPTNVVVNPSTMKILDISSGLDSNNPGSIVDDAYATCGLKRP
jgi:hypothetical protein